MSQIGLFFGPMTHVCDLDVLPPPPKQVATARSSIASRLYVTSLFSPTSLFHFLVEELLQPTARVIAPSSKSTHIATTVTVLGVSPLPHFPDFGFFCGGPCLCTLQAWTTLYLTATCFALLFFRRPYPRSKNVVCYGHFQPFCKPMPSQVSSIFLLHVSSRWLGHLRPASRHCGGRHTSRSDQSQFYSSEARSSRPFIHCRFGFDELVNGANRVRCVHGSW